MRKLEWQLVFFTIFVQMSVGIFILYGLALIFLPNQFLIGDGYLFNTILNICLVIIIFAVTVALTHLSQPLRSIFVFANMKASWLSREALQGFLFGLILLLLRSRDALFPANDLLQQVLIGLGLMVGISLIYTISRLYMLRTVPTWNNLSTPLAFYLTSFLLGALAIVTILNLQELMLNPNSHENIIKAGTWFIYGLVGLQMVSSLYPLFSKRKTEINTGGRIGFAWFDMWWLLVARWGTAFSGLWVLFILPNNRIENQIWVLTPLLLILISEILGRFLFFWQYQRVGY